jgi:3-methyladenine DNA glycosylase/8-oxoguanine DNA glycosylase
VSPRAVFAAAEAHLAALDPVMAALVKAHGPCRFRARPRVDERFASIAHAITNQQLAGVAAATIWGRVRATVGEPFTPERLLAQSEADLRAAGLSAAKTASMRDLALHVVDGRLELGRLGRLDDETVIAELSAVRGIGRWTAEMFCMFSLHRLDIWPIGDLGVRQGYAFAHRATQLPTVAELDAAGERYRPYRSVAAWYCWRAADAARRAARVATVAPVL